MPTSLATSHFGESAEQPWRTTRPGLAVRGLRKSFGPDVVLDDVDLTIAPGEVHGLLGQNGSGKSTLIKVLAAFHDADTGTLEIDGREVELPYLPAVRVSLA